MTVSKAAASGKRSVPKLQFIYFLITISGIVATLCGLYLSHLAIEVFQKSFYHAPVYELESLGTRKMLNDASQAVSILISSEAGEAAVQLKQKVQAPMQAFTAAREQVTKLAPKYFGGEEQQKVIAMLQSMDRCMSQIVALAGNWQAGSGPRDATALFQKLQAEANQIDVLVTALRASAIEKEKAAVKSLRNYEYVVGGLILLVMSSGGYYGFFIGKVMKRKFEELEKAHGDLEESHEQALAFAREIQSVNQDMGKLNVQLHENIAKLKEAQDEVLRKGKMAQLGNLTATVAHELRNPLSVVRTSAFLLGRRIKDKGLGVEPQLQRINNGIVRCDNIITQLLDFSRSKAVGTEPVVLDDWLEKLVQAEALRLPEALGIECHFGLGAMKVNIEPARFERAIINLMTNASEALVGKGDDPKSHYRANPMVSISTRLAERGVEIVVTDNGPGISMENLAKIREPLFTTKNFGTGLGIPAVEQILEHHGGGLDIQSAEGQGASFIIWLPNGMRSEAAA